MDDVYAKLTNSGATVIVMMPNLENVIMDYADISGPGQGVGNDMAKQFKERVQIREISKGFCERSGYMLNEKQKGIIEDLKVIVLDLHRSAGDLDNMVQQIVAVASADDDEEYARVFMLSLSQYRKQFKMAHGYDNLEDKENETLSRLNQT